MSAARNASGRRILMLFTGSIACARATGLITAFRKLGHSVRVACTPNALEFIGKATLESLAGFPVYSDLYADGRALDHIELSDWADLAILCPATANTLNKLAAGIADNTVTNLFLTYDLERKPFLIAPAMNGKMYQHPSVRRSIATLRGWGCTFIDPEAGRLACGEVAQGRLASESRILETFAHLVSPLRRVE